MFDCILCSRIHASPKKLKKKKLEYGIVMFANLILAMIYKDY